MGRRVWCEGVRARGGPPVEAGGGAGNERSVEVIAECVDDSKEDVNELVRGRLAVGRESGCSGESVGCRDGIGREGCDTGAEKDLGDSERGPKRDDNVDVGDEGK